MNEENQVYFVDSDKLPQAALDRKHRLEQDPSFRTNHMEYMEGMQVIESDIKDKVLKAMDEFDYDAYTAADVERALSHESCSIEDFKALLSPAAAPYLEQMARKAEEITKNHFGNTVYIFTPLYIANYCQNYCIYCGFNCYNNIRRKKLTFEEIEHEMQVIAKTGMEEILMLTGESRAYSDVTYIGEAVKIARKYFKNIGIEIYPVNVDEYQYLHECGVDYVTVFQETYNTDKHEVPSPAHPSGNHQVQAVQKIRLRAYLPSMHAPVHQSDRARHAYVPSDEESHIYPYCKFPGTPSHNLHHIRGDTGIHPHSPDKSQFRYF